MILTPVFRVSNWPGHADETMPEWAGEEAWRELAPKGQFYEAYEC